MLLTDARRPRPHRRRRRADPARRAGPHALGPRRDRRRRRAAVDGAVDAAPLGEYQLQAAIAALHDEAARAEDTDWPQILALYGLLDGSAGNPMVTLNRAVAAAMVDGPDAGLELLEPTRRRQLDGHHRLDAVRGHLHEMRGDREAAIEHYRAAAAASTTSLPERDYLAKKAATLLMLRRTGRDQPGHRRPAVHGWTRQQCVPAGLFDQVLGVLLGLGDQGVRDLLCFAE